MIERTWRDLADHYQAIGRTELILSGPVENFPWAFVTNLEWEIDTGPSDNWVNFRDAVFEAQHSGLTFKWWFRLIDHDKDGAVVLNPELDFIAKRLPSRMALIMEAALLRAQAALYDNEMWHQSVALGLKRSQVSLAGMRHTLAGA